MSHHIQCSVCKEWFGDFWIDKPTGKCLRCLNPKIFDKHYPGLHEASEEALKIERSKKVLRIKTDGTAGFVLPNDFDGSLGDAFRLLADRIDTLLVNKDISPPLAITCLMKAGIKHITKKVLRIA
jgi:hypothetical protein